MRKIAILWVMAAGTLLFAADSQVSERGQQEEQHSCVQCHSLRLVNAQRLSRAAWGKEIDKMMGWGAPVRDRNLLLDYLSEQYPDSKPVPKPELTRNGAASGSKH
ncbi:MAG TPA: hypothetical protein VN633_17155 [Bryobacteraceae bacterium]|nr:hypothetical protein [Bryobacteraceae bacterium]